MGKYFKYLLLAMVAVGLMAGPVFAGTLAVTSKSVASELIGAAAVAPDTKAPISYRPEVDMLEGATFTLKVTGGKFKSTAGTDFLIIKTGVGVLAVSALYAASTDTVTLTIPVGMSLAANTLYAIQSSDDVPETTLSLPNIEINANSAAGAAVTVEVSAASVAGATASAVTAYSVSNQFSATLTPVTSKLSFVQGMKQFVVSPTGFNVPTVNTTGSDANEAQASLSITSNEALDNKIVTDGNKLPNVDDDVTVKITANLTGITTISYRDTVDAGTTSYTVLAADRTNGYATLSVPGNALYVNLSTDDPVIGAMPLWLTVDTTTVQSVRSFTAEIVQTTGTAVQKAITYVPAGRTAFTIQLDATTLHVPFVRYNEASGLDTAIVLQSNETSSGSNQVQIYALDAAGVEQAVTITGKTEITPGTPFMVSASEIFGALASAPTLGGTKTTAVKIIVTTPETNLKAYATINSPTGDPRLVPISIEGPSSTTSAIMR